MNEIKQIQKLYNHFSLSILVWFESVVHRHKSEPIHNVFWNFISFILNISAFLTRRDGNATPRCVIQCRFIWSEFLTKRQHHIRLIHNFRVIFQYFFKWLQTHWNILNDHNIYFICSLRFNYNLKNNKYEYLRTEIKHTSIFELATTHSLCSIVLRTWNIDQKQRDRWLSLL